LIGGYFFLDIFYGTKYKVQMLESHRLLLVVAAAGASLWAVTIAGLLLLPGLALTALLEAIQARDPLLSVGTLLLSALLGPGLARLLNLGSSLLALREQAAEVLGSLRHPLFRRARAAGQVAFTRRRRLVETFRSAGRVGREIRALFCLCTQRLHVGERAWIERMALKAARESGDSQFLLMSEAATRSRGSVAVLLLVLKSRQVLAGLIVTRPQYTKLRWISLLVLAEGYCDKDSLEIRLKGPEPQALSATLTREVHVNPSEVLLASLEDETTLSRWTTASLAGSSQESTSSS
jgi:hypothetical protein